MARPTKPKDLKAEVPEGGGGDSSGKDDGGGFDLKFIITIVAIFIASVLGSVGAVYFVAPMVLVPAITAGLPKAEHGAEGGGHEAAGGHSKIGLNLGLDEFTVNLKTDPTVGGNQFLRTKISLNVGVPKEQECHKAEPAAAEGGGHGGGHGGGAPAGPDPCQTAFEGHMSPFKSTIRDIINASLMKRTAAELATGEGQEMLKDEMKEQINQVIGEEYQVLRVNFEDFIIQH